MMRTEQDGLQGVFSPVVTPFKEDLAPDRERFVRHCRWLLSQNCGLAIFGTNSEANSLALRERRALLDHLLASGLDAARMMPGTGCSSLTETVELTSHAAQAGVGGVLMLPPFYYKGISDDGLFRHFSEVIERVGDRRLKIYLYHIPLVAMVPISLGLIERLLKCYPGTVVGIKDSSGDWENTRSMLASFPGFRVFAGSEVFLLANMRHGGVGCISATANINPGAIHRLWADWQDGEADRHQTELSELRSAVAKFPMIPALKATIAHYSGDSGWTRVRPPLLDLDEAQQQALATSLKEQDFTMPDLLEKELQL